MVIYSKSQFKYYKINRKARNINLISKMTHHRIREIGNRKMWIFSFFYSHICRLDVENSGRLDVENSAIVCGALT